jgi:hypothetical protein
MVCIPSSKAITPELVPPIPPATAIDPPPAAAVNTRNFFYSRVFMFVLNLYNGFDENSCQLMTFKSTGK